METSTNTNVALNDIPQTHSLEQHSHENPQFDILTCNNLVEPLHIEQPSSTINVHNTLTSNIIYENILTTLENLSPHLDKYFQQLLNTPIYPCVCCHRLCFKIQTRKILKSMIQKYSLPVPLQEKNPLLCKSCYYYFNKNKTPKLLFPTNIRLNNDIDSIKKLNELEEQLM
jgi:hypothetical protein